MTEKHPRKGRQRRLSQDEIDAMEISEDKRLRERDIDPNANPVDIMMAVLKPEPDETTKQH